MLQGMMRGQRPKDAAKAEEAEVESEREDRPPPPAQRGRGGARGGKEAPRMKGAGGGGGQFDAACQQQFGEFAVFDGVDSCECMEGYRLVDGACAPAGAAAAARGAAGRGRAGGGGVGGLAKVDALCKREHGDGAEFDGGDACRCRPGFALR
jgi:hypothetical protein